jgi:hypothetical protein
VPALKTKAPDFFDLLSHNIEISRSLFRLLIRKLSGMGITDTEERKAAREGRGGEGGIRTLDTGLASITA